MIRSFIKSGLKKVLGRTEPVVEPKPYPFTYTPAPAEPEEAVAAPAPVPEPEAAPEPAAEPAAEAVQAAPEPAPKAAPAPLDIPLLADGLPAELSLLTVKELRAELKSRGIDVKSREHKTDLLKKLEAARSAGGSEVEDAPSEGPTLDTAVVQELLDEMVRPALQGDGGDIALVRIEGMDVYVRLVGACTTCPSSIMTMKMGVEALFKEEFPGFGELIQVD